MNFYCVKDRYIEYLRLYDSRVPYNKNETRPYVGIVLEIAGIKYYAPFTSPKQKHEKMKNGADFRKIAGGKLGAINFNNMIPVCDSELIEIRIVDIEDDSYRRLLQKQYEAIRNDWDNIVHTAQELREMTMLENEQLSEREVSVKCRCCDFKKLELVCKGFTGEIE